VNPNLSEHQFQQHLFNSSRYLVGPHRPPEKPEKIYGKRPGLGQGSMIRVWGDARPPEVRMEAMAAGPKHYTGR
jgi:hypothetical protein